MKRWIGPGLVAALGGCAFGGDVAAATRAVDGFHRQFNAGQFAAIYAAAAPAFKGTTPEPQLDALLTAVHARLGAFRSDKVTGWRVNATTGGTFANLTVTSTYTHGQAEEQFAYRIDGGRAALVNYQVNSPALLAH